LLESRFFVNGLNTDSFSIATDGKNVSVSRDFNIAGDTLSNHIVRWDGSSWHALGAGLENTSYALAVDGREHLYTGGSFLSAGGKPANCIARWTGTYWENFGSGTDNLVSALANGNGGRIFVGGSFSQAGVR